jgi:hypothetical protein
MRFKKTNKEYIAENNISIDLFKETAINIVGNIENYKKGAVIEFKKCAFKKEIIQIETELKEVELQPAIKIETETRDLKNNNSTLQDNIDAEETARINKDNQLENKITELNSILDKLKTDTTVTLSTYATKINYLYLAFYNRSMDEAIGIDPNNNIIFQYGPSII